MKRLASLLALAALVLAACGGGSGAVAATVNGEGITVGDVEALIDPGEESTIPKETFAQFLGFSIQWQIVSDAAEGEHGIVISDDDLGAEADAIFEANGQDLGREEFLEANGITEQFLLEVARQQLLDVQVREIFSSDVEEPTREQIDTGMEQAALGLSELCASHILVATEDEANAVLDRLGAGEEFAVVATAVSTDGSAAQGGDLGCAPPTTYLPEFSDAAMAAEIDVPTEPVQTDFGFHVILVSEFTEADPADLPTEDEVIEALNTQAVGVATNAWFIEQVEAAEVSVDETYGTWQASPPQVVPPTE